MSERLKLNEEPRNRLLKLGPGILGVIPEGRGVMKFTDEQLHETFPDTDDLTILAIIELADFSSGHSSEQKIYSNPAIRIFGPPE